ncbi:MAG: NHL repeat-containing protein [Verrucomicrobiia bacterium]
MKLGKTFLLAASILTICLTTVSAQIYNFTTIAGTAGNAGSSNGSSALFNSPMSVAVDSVSNIFVADYWNGTIREVIPVAGTTNWTVITIAGTAGSFGSTDGTSALFSNPAAVAVYSTGVVYVADYWNSTIRKITTSDGATWTVSTIAGTAGVLGSNDDISTSASFSNPVSVAVDSTGVVYVADYGNNTIRMIAPQSGHLWVSTIAGKAGSSGSADGTNSAARFYGPDGIAVDSSGNVYVADYGNSTIRKITPVGPNWVVSTIAGKVRSTGSTDGANSTARFHNPTGVAVDSSGNVYVADYGNSTIRKIIPVIGTTNWVVSTIGGKAGKTGSINGVGGVARFNFPVGVALDSTGNVYVADTLNETIRRGLATPGTFVPLTGVYNGLVIQTNAPTQASSGAFKLVLTETGSFAANLTMAGAGAAFGGQFDLSGNVTNTVTVAKTNSCHVILHLDMSNGTEEITGTVSNGAFRSGLVADRATFSKTTTCSLTGLYTFVLAPPTDTDPDLPQGYGYGTLSIATTGSGKLSGVLGDGTKFKATIPISKFGTGPLYGALYGKKGSCVAWLNFTNNSIEATAYWFKPAATKGFFAGGFTTNVTLVGSKYVAPAKNSPMLILSNITGNVMLTLGGGNLGSALSNSVTVATNNTVTILAGGVTNLTLKLVPKSGAFTGGFTHPVTHKTAKFNGVVLQLQDFGAGLFTGTNETGYVALDPD